MEGITGMGGRGSLLAVIVLGWEGGSVPDTGSLCLAGSVEGGGRLFIFVSGVDGTLRDWDLFKTVLFCFCGIGGELDSSE